MGDYEKMDKNFMSQDALEDDSLWELMSVYADGEATPAESAKIQALLNSDSALKRNFDFIRFASSCVASEPEITPPSSLRDTIFAATTARPTLRRRLATVWADFAASLTPRYTLAGAGAGGLAVITLLTVTLWPHNKVTTPQIAKVMTQKPQEVGLIASPGTPPVSIPPAITETGHIAPPTSEAKATVTPATRPTAAEAKKPQQLANANRVVKAAIVANHSGPSAVSKHVVTVQAPQMPSPVEPHEPVTLAYVPKPNMDRNNQRPAPSADETNKDLPDEKSAESPASAKPIVIASADASPKTERWEGHYIGPPKDSRQMTPSFMRQQQQAHNAGYSDLAINSIKQKQICLSTAWRF